MRIVVTGGAGFIRANFVHALLEGHADVDVVVLDKFTCASNHGSFSDITEKQAKHLKIIEGDIADAKLVDSIITGSDTVVHFAAESRNDNSLNDPSSFTMTNLVGTFIFLETVHRHKMRFHHISIDEVCGGLELDDPVEFTPSTPYNPPSPYSSSKAGSDPLVRAWVRSFGVEAMISNRPNNYDPYQHIEKFIPHMTTNRLRGIRPRLYGDNLDVRDWIRVHGHNAATWETLMRGRIDETYLIGADEETNSRDIVMILNELMGCAPDGFDHVADHPGHDLRYATDNAKLCEELGWSPRFTDFRSDLTDTVEWYTHNGAWWAPLKEVIEAKYAAEGH